MPKCLTSLPALLLLTALAACSSPPETTPPAEVPIQPLVVGHSAPAPTETTAPPVREAPVAVAASTPLAVAARDPRLARPPRPLAMIQAELHGLEQLLAATAAAAPDHGALVRRLADDYAEAARGGDAAARKQALTHYDLAVADAKQQPGQRNLDETYYYAALEHEMAGDLRQTRMLFYEVIKQYPQSKLIPLCYFGFGELFFTEAETDPSKLDLAEQAYLEVLKYPAATNPVFADAQSRRQEIKDLKAGAKVRRP